MKPFAKIAALLALVAALTVPLSACKTLGDAVGPKPVEVLNGAVDCLAPTFFKVVTFAKLVTLAEHAIAQQDPIGALVLLAADYGPAEVDCVVAYLQDLAGKQKLAAPSNEVVKRRAAITERWLERESAKGIGPIVNYGAVQ